MRLEDTNRRALGFAAAAQDGVSACGFYGADDGGRGCVACYGEELLGERGGDVADAGQGVEGGGDGFDAGFAVEGHGEGAVEVGDCHGLKFDGLLSCRCCDLDGCVLNNLPPDAPRSGGMSCCA